MSKEYYTKIEGEDTMSKRITIPIIILVLLMIPGVFLIMSSTNPDENTADNARNKPYDNAVQHVGIPPLPDKLSFAGEPVPLEHFEVRESLDRELMGNVFFHSQTLRYLKLMPRYLSIIEPILKKEGIPDDFKYLALAESGFDQRALSPAGAAGIWQFLKTTAKERGLEVTEEVDERYHVEKATIAACVYFRDAYAAYGSWSMVAASYNAGRAGVNRQITRQKLEDYYDLLFVEETGRYVFRILALKLIMESPDTYGFHLSKKDTYPVFQYKTVEVKSKIDNLADFAIANGTNYKLLKMFNPWLRETFLTNKEAKTYQIKIPTDRRIRNEGIN